MGPGTDFMKLDFGQKVFGQILPMNFVQKVSDNFGLNFYGGIMAQKGHGSHYLLTYI
jgi:hypothetical protein